MGRFIDLFKENRLSGNIAAEYGNLDKIRNDIIDAVYAFSLVAGTIANYGTIMRISMFGWRPGYAYNFLLYALIFLILIFRKRVSLYWKSVIFFTIFFILAGFINFFNGLISGALVFVFLTTLATLLFGWKIGLLTILLTTVVRSVIGILYYNGKLEYPADLMTYIRSVPALMTSLLGGLVLASILVFAINKFYHWLMVSLQTVSAKMGELQQMNRELIRAKEKAEEHDRLKSVFLANMSHEIRTPMNAIVGFSELLSRPKLTDEQKMRFLSLVKERSYDLMRIIEDILDLSKIEVNQMTLHDVEFDLESLLNDLRDHYTGRVKNRPDLGFTCVFSDSVKNLTVRMDNHRLKQIIGNLLDNAFKFTTMGEIEFTCSLEGKNLNFTIKDTGIGIPENKLPVIFDHFRQAEESIGSRKYGGTGLGLSIVQGIVRLMNGTIRVESEEGEGSTFYFSLPAEIGQKKTTETDGLEIPQVNWNNRYILIVEDDRANSEFLSVLLGETGAVLYFAASGTEALELVKKHGEIELILMDIRLPDINGFVLTEQIKKEFPSKKIIAQTAYAGSDDEKKCREAGCVDFIPKPIQQNRLISVLNSYLKS